MSRVLVPPRRLSLPTLSRPFVLASAMAIAVTLAGVAWVAARPADVPLPPPSGPARPGLIVYQSGGSLLVRYGLDGKPRQLFSGNDPSERFNPAWAPDGRHFMLELNVNGGTQLGIASPDGAGFSPIGPVDPIEASWAPDSRHVAMIEETSPASLAVIDALASVEFPTSLEATDRRIDLGGNIPLRAVWVPDGSSLVVEAMTYSGPRDLYVASADGASFRPLRVADHLAAHPILDASPAVSPDGATIAFAGLRPGVTRGRSLGIWTIALDGTGLRSLPGPSATAVLESPIAYSPDGRWLLIRRSVERPCCVANRTEAWLALMPADGSAPAHDLGPHFENIDAAEAAAFSPDGSQILVAVGTIPRSVYVVDTGTGTAQRLDWTADLPSWQRLAP